MILWRWNIVVLDLGLVELAHELVDKAAPFVDLGSQLLVLCEHRVCEFCVVVVKNIEYRTIKNLVIIIEVEKGTFKILCSWSFLGFSSRVQRSNGVVLYTFYTAQAF